MRQGIFQSRGLMRRSSTVLFLILAAGNLVWLSAISSSHVWARNPPSRWCTHYEYRVVQSYPHDRQAFTQGLVYEAGVLYEGTGLYGRSTLVKRDLKTGQALKTTHLARNHFGRESQSSAKRSSN